MVDWAGGAASFSIASASNDESTPSDGATYHDTSTPFFAACLTSKPSGIQRYARNDVCFSKRTLILRLQLPLWSRGVIHSGRSQICAKIRINLVSAL